MPFVFMSIIIVIIITSSSAAFCSLFNFNPVLLNFGADRCEFYDLAEFTLTPSLEAAIDKARQHYKANTSALHVDVLESKTFGKNFCKKHKISPDAVMQLGFQVSQSYDVHICVYL